MGMTRTRQLPKLAKVRELHIQRGVLTSPLKSREQLRTFYVNFMTPCTCAQTSLHTHTHPSTPCTSTPCLYVKKKKKKNHKLPKIKKISSYWCLLFYEASFVHQSYASQEKLNSKVWWLLKLPGAFLVLGKQREGKAQCQGSSLTLTTTAALSWLHHQTN